MLPNQLITECLNARLKVASGSAFSQMLLGEKQEKHLCAHALKAEQKIITAIGFTPASHDWLLVISQKPLNIQNMKSAEESHRNILGVLSKDWDYLRNQKWPQFMPTDDPRVGFVFHPIGMHGRHTLEIMAKDLIEI